jgi:hypothetical protein
VVLKIILGRGSKYEYYTSCETAYTKQHDKPGARAWMLKTIIFTEKKCLIYKYKNDKYIILKYKS